MIRVDCLNGKGDVGLRTGGSSPVFSRNVGVIGFYRWDGTLVDSLQSRSHDYCAIHQLCPSILRLMKTLCSTTSSSADTRRVRTSLSFDYHHLSHPGWDPSELLPTSNTGTWMKPQSNEKFTKEFSSPAQMYTRLLLGNIGRLHACEFCFRSLRHCQF